MRQTIGKIWLSMVVAIGCALAMTGQVRLQTGVSHELAQYRSQHISNVKYDLTLNLPADRTTAVGGMVTLSFDWTGEEDLQIDFQGQLGSALVNHSPCEVRCDDEHIVIASDRLYQGQNEILLYFSSLDQALNRHDDYMYTLFVPDHARSVFPCFDQPDLKARYELTLMLPTPWCAISNAAQTSRSSLTDHAGSTRDIIYFAPTDPLPTYLFSFTAGRFERYTASRNGHDINILYRETDPAKVAQLPQIADEMAQSIQWMEQYTGITQPFAQYGTVVLPGYQFGGMEHPGCIQLRDRTIFLGPNPSPDERMKRLQLIAHETAHLWFGDLVTMRWFNDVWTKEVFANFMADKVCRERFPDLDHDLAFMRAHYIPAIATDRTDGTHAIQQPLDNLNLAGMLYGNIIYHKAPIMMRKLEERMGQDNLQQGLQTYLRRYAYGNATWDQLIDILQAQAPQAGIREFDQQWVKHKGMPVADVALNDTTPLPNADGRDYVRYRLADSDAVMRYASRWDELTTAEGRLAGMMTLYDNMLMHRIGADEAMPIMLQALSQHNTDDQLLAAFASYATATLGRTSTECRPEYERSLWQLARSHPSRVLRQSLLRSLGQMVQSLAVVDSVYEMWQKQNEPLLNTNDLTRIAWHLAIVLPDQWQQILATQRARLTTDDQHREFDFVSRACTPDTAVQRQLFESLLLPANRRVEPSAVAMMRLLNHPLREPVSNRYILPALEALEDVRRTGDIFFPLNWCHALLDGHRSQEAREQVRQFVDHHPSLDPQLMGKLLQAADPLLN